MRAICTLQRALCCTRNLINVVANIPGKPAGSIHIAMGSKAIICSSLLLLFATTAYSVDVDNKECHYCNLLVQTFKAGVKKTEKQHFAGGNTDWEERNLGRFATSETRLVEIMEYICKKKYLENSDEFVGVKDIEFKCQGLAEEHEELVEEWYYKKQDSDPNMFSWLCVDQLASCCPTGHYGPKCDQCPGVAKSKTACYGRGKCHGDGSRKGKGKCKCDKGYVGVMCSNCDAHYFAKSLTETSIECVECFDGCASGCTAEGAKGCRACRSGYIMDAELGCKDLDECLEEDKCLGENEICKNSVGSYSCECAPGYKKNKEDDCELDVEATTSFPSTNDTESRDTVSTASDATEAAIAESTITNDEL
uniref:Cysteine-rich with EGF-like domain protein 2 n=1 Tax=Steinernema glaseri TaxID=37863 RepID=A0A1I7ZKC7_9BILA